MNVPITYMLLKDLPFMDKGKKFSLVSRDTGYHAESDFDVIDETGNVFSGTQKKYLLDLVVPKINDLWISEFRDPIKVQGTIHTNCSTSSSLGVFYYLCEKHNIRPSSGARLSAIQFSREFVNIALDIEINLWTGEHKIIGLELMSNDELKRHVMNPDIPKTECEYWAMNRIIELEDALNKLIDIAGECDSWESFPTDALDEAEFVIG